MEKTKKNSLDSTSQVSSEAQTSFDKGVSQALEIVQDGIVVYFMGFQSLAKLFYYHLFKTVAAVTVFTLLCAALVNYGQHLLAIHYMAPELFSAEFLQGLYRFGFAAHLGVVVAILSAPILFAMGCHLQWLRGKYEKIFRSVGIKNGKDQTPSFIRKEKNSSGLVKLYFDANAVGLESFKAKRSDLESALNGKVEDIAHGKSRKEIVIHLSSEDLPRQVNYSHLMEAKKLRPYSFYIGKSSSGILTQSIADLPHLLIAGTTGAGKSVFFKQALLGLLQSSPSLKMYLIDLKKGLEMSDFKDAPNVSITSDSVEAVQVLKEIKDEMDRRFEYLQANGLKKIDPKRDQLPRIIVAVDESSELYMARQTDDPDYEYTQQARRLTDQIAKLARASGIHLILATQKVSKETIDTNIQENISGRLCLATNTNENSVRVLGNGDANKLPSYSGRAIWSLGNYQIEVQCPFIEDFEITRYCANLQYDQQFRIKDDEESSDQNSPNLDKDLE